MRASDKNVSWLDRLIMWARDDGTAAARPALDARVARLAPKFAAMVPEVEWRARAAIVQAAMRHTTNPDVRAVCKRVVALCERRGRRGIRAVADAVMAKAAEAARVEAVVAGAAVATRKVGNATAAARVAWLAAAPVTAADAVRMHATGAAGAARAAQMAREEADHLAVKILDMIEWAG